METYRINSKRNGIGINHIYSKFDNNGLNEKELESNYKIPQEVMNVSNYHSRIMGYYLKINDISTKISIKD
ncbi:MAG: hypothetical protein WC781_04755 [Candidatus Pacearchaeota archaeon]|jgi:hypothetical protein